MNKEQRSTEKLRESRQVWKNDESIFNLPIIILIVLIFILMTLILIVLILLEIDFLELSRVG